MDSHGALQETSSEHAQARVSAALLSVRDPGLQAPGSGPRKPFPGKPVAYNYGLLCLNNGLLWSIVACDFGLLGFFRLLLSMLLERCTYVGVDRY